jgi:hypothetical protein
MLRPSGTLLAALLLGGCLGGSDEAPANRADGGAQAALVIAPLLSNTFFCDEARGSSDIVTEDQAAIFCASLGRTAGTRVDRALSELGPPQTRDGRFQLATR